MPNRFALLTALAAVVLVCGDPTGSPVDPDPIPWTPSLEFAAESLEDPIVDEVFGELADSDAAGLIRSIVAEAVERASARDVAAAAALVAEARQALRDAYPQGDDIQAAVLDLILRDVDERFQQALTAA